MKNNKLKATIRTSEGYETIEIDQLTESMDIVKIGNKHMKPYVYVRELDFTNLSDADSMNSIVEEAFKISKGEDNVILKVNSIHVEELKSQIDKWKISYGIKNEIFVLKDETLEPGNAVLEKPSGIIKVGVEIGMEQIRKALFS